MTISFLFPPPSSWFVTVMSIISCLSLTNGGYTETKGKHMSYSKFFNVMASKQPNKDHEIKLASRNGMLLLYTPAFLVGLVSWAIFLDRNLRFVMVISVLTIHFLKRVLEVQCFSLPLKPTQFMLFFLLLLCIYSKAQYQIHTNLGHRQAPTMRKYRIIQIIYFLCIFRMLFNLLISYCIAYNILRSIIYKK